MANPGPPILAVGCTQAWDQDQDQEQEQEQEQGWGGCGPDARWVKSPDPRRMGGWIGRWPGELAFPVMEKVYGMEFVASSLPQRPKSGLERSPGGHGRPVITPD